MHNFRYLRRYFRSITPNSKFWTTLIGVTIGCGVALYIIGHTPLERRVLLRAIIPVWESNQVWLILSVGATFAIYPLVYGIAFSVLYTPIFIMLIGLIIRPVAFKLRIYSQIFGPNLWDGLISGASLIIILSLGFLLGSIVYGVPFSLSTNLHVISSGPITLTQFHCLIMLFLFFLFLTHSGCFLINKTTGEIHKRLIRLIKWSVPCVALFWILILIDWYFFGYHYAFDTNNFKLNTPFFLPTSSLRTLISENTSLMHRFFGLCPMLMHGSGLLSLIPVYILSARHPKLSWTLSMMSVALFLLGIGYSIAPFILPSWTNPEHSLTFLTLTSSSRTLMIMLIMTIILMPIVLILIFWAYRVFKGVDLPEQ